MHDVMVSSERFQPISIDYLDHVTKHTTKMAASMTASISWKVVIVGDKPAHISLIYDDFMSCNLLTCDMECLLYVAGVDDSNVIPFTKKAGTKRERALRSGRVGSAWRRPRLVSWRRIDWLWAAISLPRLSQKLLCSSHRQNEHFQGEKAPWKERKWSCTSCGWSRPPPTSETQTVASSCYLLVTCRQLHFPTLA